MRSGLVALLLLACLVPAHAVPLRVEVTGDPPFIVRQPNGTYDGISMRIWQAVAARCGVDFQVTGRALADPAITDVVEGRADVVVGPVGVTSERARRVQFSRAYYHAGQGIASRIHDHGWLELLHPYIVTGAVLLGAMLLLVFLVGHGVWWFERHRNPDHFPKGWGGGVATGMWVAVVTITSVGYGDRVPQSRGGRIFMAFWMVMSMLFASTLTATLTSSVTLWRVQPDHFDTPASLAHRRVASVSGSSSAVFARQWAGDVLGQKDVAHAMRLLTLGQVEAVIFHEPELRDWIAGHPQEPIHLAVVSQAMSEYAFAFARPVPGSIVPDNLPLVTRVNLALLQMAETGELERLEDEWMGREREAESPGL